MKQVSWHSLGADGRLIGLSSIICSGCGSVNEMNPSINFSPNEP